MDSKILMAIFVVLTIAFGAIAGYEEFDVRESTVTSTVTMTTTVTSYGSASTPQPPIFANGTMRLEWLGSTSLNATALSFGIENKGQGPLSISYVIVNNVTIGSNAPAGWFAVKPNPVAVNSSATVTINSPSIVAEPNYTYHVTLVSDEGLMLTDLIYFCCGLVSTTTTTVK